MMPKQINKVSPCADLDLYKLGAGKVWRTGVNVLMYLLIIACYISKRIVLFCRDIGKEGDIYNRRRKTSNYCLSSVGKSCLLQTWIVWLTLHMQMRFQLIFFQRQKEEDRPYNFAGVHVKLMKKRSKTFRKNWRVTLFRLHYFDIILWTTTKKYVLWFWTNGLERC